MACPSSSSTSASSCSSSSHRSSFIAAIILAVSLGALILRVAVAGVSGGLGSKEYELLDLSQSRHPCIRSPGLSAPKVISFDRRGGEDREKEGGEVRQEDDDQKKREVFESRIGIFPKGDDDKDSEGRRIGQETTNQFPGLEFNKSLLTLRGNVLSSFPCEKCYIRSLLLSQDEQTIYFANDNNQTTSLIGKVIRLSSPSSSPPSATLSQAPPTSYSVSNVTVIESIRVTGLEMLVDKLWVLVGYRGQPGIYQVNVNTGTRQAFISGPAAVFGMVRHPKAATLFIGANLRVLMVELSEKQAPPESRSTIAGGIFDGDRDGTGEDALFGSESPRINPRSISSDGSVLYIADRGNLRVRRLYTTTNETKTLSFANGTQVHMPFGPLAVVITSDHCNIFVTGWTNYENPTGLPSVVRWLALNSPHGNVSWLTDIVTFNQTAPTPSPQNLEWTGVNEPSRLLLGHKDTDLYIGTSNGEIFQFAINRSALHKCGPDDPADPPGFGPLQPYVRPDPDEDFNLKLTVSLSVTAALVLLGVSTTLVLWWRRMLCFHSKRGLPGICVNASIPAHQLKEEQQRVRGRYDQDKTSFSPSTWNDSTTNFVITNSSLDYGDQLALSSISRELDRLDAPQRIPFADLQEATNGFSDTHKVVGARGGFGDLYRATMRVGGERGETADVGLKVMRGALDKVKRKQFISEVTTLSRARHVHLCKLLGYCVEGNMVVLVYPFVSGGSLHDRLHPRPQPSAQPQPYPTSGPPPSPRPIPPCAPLDWRSRLSVALQIATALRYLHEELDPPLLHRDVKSSNVLVDGYGEKVKAYLTDFGLARIGNPSTGLERGRETVQTAYRAGTIGYMAPEYAIELKLTTKNDVYAFGVILLELVTGKSGLFWSNRDQSKDDDNLDTYDDAPSDSDSDGGRQPIILVHWTRKKFERVANWDYQVLSKMVDPQLVQSFEVPGGSDWERETLCAVAKQGQICTDADANNRPMMGVVVERIKEIMQGERR